VHLESWQEILEEEASTKIVATLFELFETQEKQYEQLTVVCDGQPT
jgi:hypothetical protein